MMTSQKTTSEDILRLNIDINIDNKNADVLCLEDCIVKGTGPFQSYVGEYHKDIKIKEDFFYV